MAQPHPDTKHTLQTQFYVILQFTWEVFETQLWAQYNILLSNKNPFRELPVLWLADNVTSC